MTQYARIAGNLAFRFGGAFVTLTICVAVLAAGCKKSANAKFATAQNMAFPACEGLEHSDVDINGDGRADAVRVTQDGVLQCERFDFNFDGITDMIRVYSDGKHKKLEGFDHDHDGQVDALAHYRADQTVQRLQLDLNFDQVMDADFQCAGGLVWQAERARNRKGHVDTWEIYKEGVLTEAKYDNDGDGLPERVDHYEKGVLISTTLDDDRKKSAKITDEIPLLERQAAQAPLRCETPVAVGKKQKDPNQLSAKPAGKKAKTSEDAHETTP